MPGPSWLTGWVKLNNKHVVFGDNAPVDHKNKKAPRTQATSSTCASGGDPDILSTSNTSKRGRRNRRNRSAAALQQQQQEQRTVHNEIIGREGLVLELPVDGTTSAGDAAPAVTTGTKLASALKVAAAASPTSSRDVLDFPPMRAAIPVQAMEEDDDDDDHALAHTESHPASARCSIPHTVTVATTTAPPPPPPVGGSRGGGGGLGGLLAHPFFSGEAGHQQPAPCATCVDLDTQLMAALDDLEYMRAAALKSQSEALQLSCENKPLHNTANNNNRVLLGPGAAVAAPRAIDSSKQLHEVVARHQNQVEQLTKERFRWQQEMHLKLNKFASLCKSLNEESAVLNNECATLREDLDRVQSERNAASEELMILRAKAEQHEREKLEFAACQARLAELEKRDLESRTAMQSRDAMIHELSSKLEEAMDCLEKKERAER